MNDTRGTERTRAAWERASETAAELHAEWGATVPLTYFVVWLAGGFVIALFIGWVTAPFAVWRGAGGTLQVFGVIVVALHMMARKRRGDSRLQQLATEIRMLWRNVVSQDPVVPQQAAKSFDEHDSAALAARLKALESAVLELRQEIDAEYVGPLSGLKPARPAVDKIEAAASPHHVKRIQLQWVGVSWILMGIVLATWS